MATLLPDIAPGTRIRVIGFDAETRYTAQLRRLGLVPGTEVTILRRAPFGDALEVRLRGYSLALRPSEASSMKIEIIPA